MKPMLLAVVAVGLAPAAHALTLDELAVAPCGDTVPLNARMFVNEQPASFRAALVADGTATPVDLSRGSLEEGFELPELRAYTQYTLSVGLRDNESFTNPFRTSDAIDDAPPSLAPDVIARVGRDQCDEGACPLFQQRYLASLEVATAEDDAGVAFYSVYAVDGGERTLLARELACFGGYVDETTPTRTVQAPLFEGESKVLVVTATDFAGNESEPTREVEVSTADAAGGCASISSGGAGLLWALVLAIPVVTLRARRRRARPRPTPPSS